MMVNETIIPLLVISKTFLRAVVDGPIQCGGMSILKYSMRQDQWGLQHFV